MIPLALFDLDGTLLDRSAAFRAWADRFAARRRLPEGAVEEMVAADGDGFRSRVAFFEEVRDRFAIDTSVETLIGLYNQQYPDMFRPEPAVLAALAALRDAGWRIGIVTNGVARNQLAKIRNAGLADAVDAWAVSGAEGIRKPDPVILARAAARCGTELAPDTWMVGDNPGADILGGHRAGVRTLWMRRGRTWPGDPVAYPDVPAPDAEAETVPEAVELVLAATA